MIIRPPPLRISRRTFIKAAAVSLAAPAILTLGSREAKAAIALVSHTFAKGDGTTSSPGIDTSTATLLVGVGCGFTSTTNQTITDSKGNTWVLIGTGQNSTGSTRMAFYYVASPTVGAGHTFTVANLGLFSSICVAAFRGTSATPLDLNAQSSGAAGATAGPITPSVANCLVVAAAGEVDASSVTGPSGYTVTDIATYTGGTSECSGLAYVVQTSAASTSAAWGGSTPASALASFKPGGAAPACVPTRALMGVGC